MSEPRIDVHCEGDLEDVAAEQGAKLRDRVEHALSMLPGLEAIQAAKPTWMPFPVFRRIAEGVVRSRWSRRLDSVCPEMNRGLDALAAAARASPRTIRLLNALEPLLSSVRGRTTVPIGGCSTIAVRGSRSSDGDPVIARNFDYLPITQPTYMFRRRRPSGGPWILEFTLAPLVGTVDGMNEHGLCITYNYGFTIDRPTYTTTISMVVARVLERCRTVSEAAEMISASPRWGGGLLMLADRDGDLASMELSSSRASIRRPVNGTDVIFHTNCFHTPEAMEVEVARSEVFKKNAPRSLVGKRVLASSEERYGRFQELLGHERPLAAEDLLAIMADHGEEGEPGDGTLCVHSPYWYTSATMQYHPRARRVRVAYDTACRAQFTDLEV